MPGSETLAYLYNSNNKGTLTLSPGSIPPRRLWKTNSNWPFVNWLRLMEPLRGESCPSGECRGPAAPEEDKFPCPGQKPLHISSTPTTRGRKRRSTGCLPPHRLCNPETNLLVAD